jgi:anti-anti-sigma factor
MLGPEFAVTTARVNDCVEVTVTGELDEATVDGLRSAFIACDSNRPLVVDLTALTFISSAGIHVLLKECLRGRPAALVVAEGSHVERVLDIARVSKSVPVYHDLGAAIEFPRVTS